MDNPLSQQQFNKLHKAIEWSIKQLEFARKERVAAIKELVGSHYMPGGSNKIMPVNATKLTFDIYARHLTPRNPRCMLTAKRIEYVPDAKNFELAVNQIPAEIGLSKTFRDVVLESLISPIGIIKCGIQSTSSVLGHPYGETFVDCITLDNYFCDLSAKDWSLIQFEGNDYWMEYEDFKAWIDAKDRKDILADDYEVTNSEGGQTAQSVVSSDTAEVYRDRIHLRDVWLPKEQILLTYAIKTQKVVSVVHWESDAPRPYIRIGYIKVPGNLLYLPPIACWRDLNELQNALFRKLGSSADAYKKVLVFRSGDDTDVQAFKQCHNGDGMTAVGSQKPEEWEAGGVDPKTLAFFMQVKELYSYYAGNLDSLGGLAPMATTIGQDKLLAEAASAQIRDMSDQMVDFVREVFKALAYYEWTNPASDRLLKKDIAGETIDVMWTDESKRGEFNYYDVDIDVYSLPDDSPMLRLQKLGMFLQTYVLPFESAIAQLGGNIDVEQIIKDAAELSNLRNAEKYVTFPDDPAPTQQGSTQRYVGAARSPQAAEPQGVPQQSASADLMQQLLSSE